MRIEGTTELQILADRLKEMGDRGLQRRVSKALRGVAQPIGQRVLSNGASRLPRHGGLAQRVANGKVGVRVGLAGRAASVSLVLKDRNSDDLGGLDAGLVRHPVFGNRKNWVAERIRPKSFTEAFEAEAPTARRAVLTAANEAIDDVARGI